MKVSTTIEGVFNCSLERAFQAPILGDATKFLNGYLLQSPVIRFENDDSWGQVGGVRYPVVAGSLLFKETKVFRDEILERNENQYWKWQVYEFETWHLFFLDKGIGQWEVQQLVEGKVKVYYTYTYYPKLRLYYPITCLFVKIQIRGMMKQAIKGIRQQAESGVGFVYK